MFCWFEFLILVFLFVDGCMLLCKVLLFYLYYLCLVWLVLLVILIVGLLLVLVEVVMFDYLGCIVDMVVEQFGVDFFKCYVNELGWMLFIMVIVWLILVGLYNLLVNQVIVFGLSNCLCWLMYNYVVWQSLSFFQNDFVGSVVNWVMQIGILLCELVVQMVDLFWYIVVYIGMVLYLFVQVDWWLMVLLVLWLLVYVVIMVYFVLCVKEWVWIVFEVCFKVMGCIVDGYINIFMLKLFVYGGCEQVYVVELIQELVVKYCVQIWVIIGMDLIIVIVNGFLIVGICGLVLWLWNGGYIIVGVIMLVIGLVICIYNMFGWIMWIINGIFEDIGMVQDGIIIIVQLLIVQDCEDVVLLQVICGGVYFQDIYFYYGKKGGVIVGLDLVVKLGEKIGLVGFFGVGKLILVNVLLCLYDLESGCILIDGQDIVYVIQESLCQQIGVVIQDILLLYCLICDNLLYGCLDVIEEQLCVVVVKVCVGVFIDMLVDGQGCCGYDVYVGECGVKFFGGQCQCIVIVCVLLKDVLILVLDEVILVLDLEVEVVIQDSLDELMGGKMVIVIVYWLLIIVCMDWLVVMDQGCIVEIGSYVELIVVGGLYVCLWVCQIGGFVVVD